MPSYFDSSDPSPRAIRTGDPGASPSAGAPFTPPDAAPKLARIEPGSFTPPLVEATVVPFTPAAPVNWPAPGPWTVAQALDDLATAAPCAVVSVGTTAPIGNSGSATAPVIDISAATDLAAGSMSAADKTKLDGINDYGASATVQSPASGAVVHLSASDFLARFDTSGGATATAVLPVATYTGAGVMVDGVTITPGNIDTGGAYGPGLLSPTNGARYANAN